jgi:hypothetical protein
MGGAATPRPPLRGRRSPSSVEARRGVVGTTRGGLAGPRSMEDEGPTPRVPGRREERCRGSGPKRVPQSPW